MAAIFGGEPSIWDVLFLAGGLYVAFVALCFFWVAARHGLKWFPSRFASKKAEYQELNERARLKAQRVRWNR